MPKPKKTTRLERRENRQKNKDGLTGVNDLNVQVDLASEDENVSTTDVRSEVKKPDVRLNKEVIKDIATKLAVFDGSNFDRWSDECRVVLELTDMLECVERDCSTESRSLDKMCSAYINSHLSEKIKNELSKDNDSAYELWRSIKDWYGYVDRVELDSAFRKFKNLRLESEDYASYKDAFMSILKSFKKYQVNIDDRMCKSFYFDGLGERATRYREMKYFDNLNCKETAIEVTRMILAAGDSQTKFVDMVHKRSTKGQAKFQNKYQNGNPKSTGKFYRSPSNEQKRSDFRAEYRKLPFYQPKVKSEIQQSNSESNQKKPKNLGGNVSSEEKCWKCGTGGHRWYECNEFQRKVQVLLAHVTNPQRSRHWIFDTGAAVHVCNDKQQFDFITDTIVTFGTSDLHGTLEAIGVGQVSIVLENGQPIEIPNVYYCPKASCNLMTNIGLNESIRFMLDSRRGYIWLDDEEETEAIEFCRVVNQTNLVLVKDQELSKISAVTRSTSRQQMKSIIVNPSTGKAISSENSPEHRTEPNSNPNDEMQIDETESESENNERNIDQKYRDVNETYIQKICKQRFANQDEMHQAYGHPGIVNHSRLARIHGFNPGNYECTTCNKFNLLKRSSTITTQKWAKQPNELVHIDLCEPYPGVEGYDGAKYFVIIVDDYTGLLNVYTVRSKSALDVYEVFNKYRAHVERWHGPIKVVRSDFGREFENKIWLDKVFGLGITHEHGPAYLHGNVKAERANRTIEDKCKKLIETSELNQRYWSEAVKTAAYTYNRTPNKFGIAPHILFYGRYDQRRLYSFGTPVFYYDPSPHNKGYTRQRNAIFMGYDKKSLQYRVLDCESSWISNQMNITKTNRFS